jgi:hypothetical protein
MLHLRSVVAGLIGISALGCRTVTECDCAVPFGFIFGNGSGSATRALVEARVGPGPCRDDYFPTTVVEKRLAEANGSYEVQFFLPAPGAACVVVTADAFLEQEAPAIANAIRNSLMRLPSCGRSS